MEIAKKIHLGRLFTVSGGLHGLAKRQHGTSTMEKPTKRSFSVRMWICTHMPRSYLKCIKKGFKRMNAESYIQLLCYMYFGDTFVTKEDAASAGLPYKSVRQNTSFTAAFITSIH